MSAAMPATTVVKNKTTVRDREFWSHVETVASQSRSIRQRSLSQVVNSNGEAAANREEHSDQRAENQAGR
jgi:hypothetical protein